MGFVLAAGIALMAIKFLAWYLTNSNAILTDALESVVNVVAGAFALYSVYYASLPRDDNHPYGHGKIEFLSAGAEGGMITLAGLAMLVKGIAAFFTRDVVKEADVGAYLSAFAGLANYFLGTHLIKKGKKYNSSVLVADGKHLISDTVSSVGLVLGLILIYFTKLNWIDYVVTIIFGLAIIYTGVKLVYESIANLLDKADEAKLKQLIELLEKNRRPGWIDVHNLRVLKYGAHLHVDCHLTLPWYNNLEETHTEVHAVEELVKAHTNDEIEFFIHADPCLPASCPVCTIFDCPHRKEPFTRKLEWTSKNVLPNRKHGLE